MGPLGRGLSFPFRQVLVVFTTIQKGAAPRSTCTEVHAYLQLPNRGGVEFPIDSSLRRGRRYAISEADRKSNEAISKEGSVSGGS
jgi:hypothetical protein